ncbi:MAG TPA: hypothetical protein DCY12_10510 [Candidatus Atribacteria bacterium]|nr:hypothetical protein [Candidatus Atribacteria bacterium]
MTRTQKQDEVFNKGLIAGMLLNKETLRPFGYPTEITTYGRRGLGQETEMKISDKEPQYTKTWDQLLQIENLGFETSISSNMEFESYLKSKELNHALEAIFQECSQKNWDGYDASPISEETYLEAKKFIKMLCSLPFPLPEILPEPDGQIGFEWFKEKNNLFTISLTEKNLIYYAGIFGENGETCGKEKFTDSMPKVILDNLSRLFPLTYKDEPTYRRSFGISSSVSFI